MRRRTVLGGAEVVLASAVAGCFGNDGGSDEKRISVSAPTVTPGETATVSVEATRLTGLHISDFPEEFLDGSMRLGDATFTPPPDAVFESYPPHWEFSGRDTEGDVSIETSPETTPDAYRFVFDVRTEWTEGTRPVETTVTVEDSPSE